MDAPMPKKMPYKGDTVIGNDVWIGKMPWFSPVYTFPIRVLS